MQNIWSAHKTGLELYAALFYHSCKLVSRGLAVRGKLEMGSQDALCLCPVFRICDAESSHDPGIQVFIGCHIFTQYFTRFDHQ